MACDGRDRIAVARDQLADRREQAADQRERGLDEGETRLLEREASVLRQLRSTTDVEARQAHQESVHEQLDRSAQVIDRSRAHMGRDVAAEARRARQGDDEQWEIDREVQRTRRDPTWGQRPQGAFSTATCGHAATGGSIPASEPQAARTPRAGRPGIALGT